MGILESSAPSGHVLRLILEQAADRVAHRIEVLDSDAIVVAELRSVEGTSAEQWPASPALQSCSLQEIRPAQTAAFLVGMAGKSHWSASMEAVIGQGELIFDLACRALVQSAWIGSTYELATEDSGGAALFDSGHAETGITFRGSRLWVLPEPAGETGVSRCEVSAKNRLRIHCPIEPGSSHRSGTIRWRYRMRLMPCILD